MLKAVIFDMDGVIIDSELIYHDVEMKLFKELGLGISEEERSRYVGTKTSEMWVEFKERFDICQSVDELVEIEAERYREYIRSMDDIRPIPGVAHLIRELAESRIRLALASSSFHEDINTVLDIFRLRRYFEVIVSGEDVENGKPAPDIFRFAMKRLGVEPHECVVIEDSGNGVKAAKAAGIRCLAYRNKSSGNQDLSPADMVTDSFEEINVGILGRLCRQFI